MPFCVDRYQCTENYCSKENGLSRADVIGCLYFCARDKDNDGELSLDEFKGDIKWCTDGGKPSQSTFFVAIIQTFNAFYDFS